MRQQDRQKFNTQAYQHKVHLKYFPAPKQAIYAITDAEGNVIRIGSSIRTSYRIAQHLKYKCSTFAKRHYEEGMSWTIVEDADGLNPTELHILEQHYIDLFKPKFNKTMAITPERAKAYFESLKPEGDECTQI